MRVVKLGKRRLDKAQMAYIEYIGNPIEIYEDEEKIKRQEEKGIPTFWDWEMKILEQELEFYENEIMRLRGQDPTMIDNGEKSDDVYIDIDPNEETKVFFQQYKSFRKK